MKVLILEDDENRIEWFYKKLFGYSLDVTKDPKKAIELLFNNEYDFIFLDHDLQPHHYTMIGMENQSLIHDEETGYAVADWLGKNPNFCKDANIIIHSMNPTGSQRMLKALNVTRKAQWIYYPELVKRLIVR